MKYFVAEGTNVTRSSKCHDYNFAVISCSATSTRNGTGGFRAERASAENEAARLNRSNGAGDVWVWKVVPALEISAAEFRALNAKTSTLVGK